MKKIWWKKSFCFVQYIKIFSSKIRYYKYFIIDDRPSVLDLLDCIQWSNILFELSAKKTLIVLYTFSRFLKELGQKIFQILFSVVSPDLCQELWSVHCLCHLLCSLLCPVPQAFKRCMKCSDYFCQQHRWPFHILFAVTRFLYSREGWRALGAKYL
jgi:hypothetical protein